jgi:hypothetical protein
VIDPLLQVDDSFTTQATVWRAIWRSALWASPMRPDRRLVQSLMGLFQIVRAGRICARLV